MAKGKRCPFCYTLTIQIDDSESFSECSKCEFVGWWLADSVRPGPGLGYKCVNCQKSTLHYFQTKAGVEVYRCSKCLYSGVKATKAGVGGEAS